MNKLETQLSSLGVAYVFSQEFELSFEVPPEEIIINVCNYEHYWDDNKYYSLLRLWFLSYSELINIELLFKNIDRLSPQGVALLYALTFTGGARWNRLNKALESKLSRNIKINSDRLCEKLGMEECLKEFKVAMAKIPPANEKKLKIRRIVLKNPWLFNRLKFGVNLRADISTVIENNLLDTAYQAAKFFNTSMRATYKNWNELKEIYSLMS